MIRKTLFEVAVFLCHRIGESTKPMTKAKISTHKGVAEQTFTPAHVTIFASDLSDLSENSIMNKVSLTALLKLDLIPMQDVTAWLSSFLMNKVTILLNLDLMSKVDGHSPVSP